MSDEIKEYDIRVSEFRTRLSKWLDKVQNGSVVLIRNYDTYVGQLIPYSPMSGIRPQPETKPLAAVYYAADARFPQSARITAGVLSRASAGVAARIASMSLHFEAAEKREKENPTPSPESKFIESSTHRLVTEEEMRDIPDEAGEFYDERLERKEEAFGSPPRRRNNGMNNATKPRK